MTRLPGALQAFRRKASVRAVGVMALSSALGQLAVLCTLPLLTRLYEPAAFGIHALFMAFVGVASVGVCLCLEHRCVSTASEAEADNMLAGALMAVPVTALVSAAVMAALIGFGLFGYHQLPLWCVPLVLLLIGLNGVYAACRSRIVRQQDYKAVARAGLTQNLGRALAPLLMFPLAPFWLGLSGGEVAGRMVGVRSLAQRVLHLRLGTAVWRRAGPWWALLRTEYRFTALLMGTVLVDAVASQMIAPLLAATYGAQSTGQYFLAFMVVVGPSVLIGAAAADVIHAKGAEMYRREPATLPAFARRSAALLLALGLAIFLPVYLLAPVVVPYLFGDKWPLVAGVVQALTPFAVIGFVASPCSRLLASINRPMVKVLSDVVRLIGVPLTIYWSHREGQDFMQAVWNLSWFLAAAYALYFALTYLTVVWSVRRQA